LIKFLQVIVARGFLCLLNRLLGLQAEKKPFAGLGVPGVGLIVLWNL